MVKRIIKFFSFMLCILMLNTQICMASDSNVDGNYLNNVGRKTEEIGLYDENENVVAYYKNLSNGGYAIISADGNECIEFSRENIYGELSYEKKYYYSGPLGMYTRDTTNDNNIGEIKNVITEEYTRMDEIEFSVQTGDVSVEKVNNTRLNIENSCLESNMSTRSGTNTLLESRYLAHSTERYSYNPDGRCGSVATAIVLKYYYDYRSIEYIDSTQVTSDGVRLINLLTDYYIPTNAGYVDMVNGIGNYLTYRFSYTGMRINATYIHELNSTDVYNRLKNYVANDRPLILGLLNHPKYTNHWVVGTGYQRFKYVDGSTVSYTNYACVNNGWGDTNIFINFSYIDGCVCF